MIRLLVGLSLMEAEALARWATSELRDPRDQIRFLLRHELRNRGLLSDDKTQGQHIERNDKEGISNG